MLVLLGCYYEAFHFVGMGFQKINATIGWNNEAKIKK